MASTTADYIREQRAAGLTANGLINEKSPYLLQHAFNPVHWLPWGDEALALSKQQDKPIFPLVTQPITGVMLWPMNRLKTKP